MINKPILFVHIPKTGGTSINNVLHAKYGYSWRAPDVPLRNHQPIFILEKYNDLSDFFVFTVVRNPFKRAYSYYQHYKRIRSISLNGVPQEIPTFSQFLLDIQSQNQTVDDLKHLDSISAFEKGTTTPFVPFTQSFYLFDSNGNMRMDKIYRHENMAELESDFDVKLSKLNTGNYKESMYYEDYTPRMIDLVREIYAEDFTNFGYSTEFV